MLALLAGDDESGPIDRKVRWILSTEPVVKSRRVMTADGENKLKIRVNNSGTPVTEQVVNFNSARVFAST
jgi:hypothetical protein